MLYSHKILTLLFILILPLEALAATQSSDLVQVEVQHVHLQADEQTGTCTICLDPIPSLSSALTTQDFVETLEKTYQTRIQQLTEALNHSDAPADREAIHSELTSVTEAYQVALQKGKAAGEMIQKLSFKDLIKAFALAQKLIEERVSKLKQRLIASAYPYLSMSDDEKVALNNQIQSEEVHHLILAKYLQLFSDPHAEQSKIRQMLKAFRAEPDMLKVYSQSLAHCLEQSFPCEADVVLLDCTHRFHKECLSAFAKPQCLAAKQPARISLTCPLCRAPMSKNDVASLPIEITVDDLLSFYENQRGGQHHGQIYQEPFHAFAAQSSGGSIYREPSTYRGRSTVPY